MNSVSFSNRANVFTGAVVSVSDQGLADRILEEVRRSPDCELDALVLSLPEVPWQDVLLEVHRLSNTGQLQLSAWGAGIYTARVTNELGQSNGLMPIRAV